MIVRLDAAVSTETSGGRPMQFTWGVMPPVPALGNVTATLPLPPGFTPVGNTLSLAFGSDALPAGTYTFALTVANFFGLQSTPATVTVRSSRHSHETQPCVDE